MKYLLLLLCLALPVHADVSAPFETDDHTLGLWRFDGDPAQGFADRSGNGRTATVDPRAPAVMSVPAPAVLSAASPRVARIDRGAILLPKVGDAIKGGAFTIEVRALLDRDGYVFRTTDAHGPTLAYLSRDAGVVQLTYQNRAATGTQVTRVKSSRSGIAEHFGRISYETYHHIALTYDGSRTLAFHLDGHMLATFEREGADAFYFERGDLVLGHVAKFNGTAMPEIAECRVSNVARTFTPAAVRHPENFAAALAAQAVRLDMVTAESPVAEDFLGVAPGDVYTSRRGYGWMEAPSDAFDSWFIGGWYKYKPEEVIAEGGRYVPMTHLRDGHHVADGAVFRVDVPPGKWDVTVHVGHPWENRTVDRIEGNGVMIGENLITIGQYWRIYPVDRAARSVVDVGADGLTIAFQGKAPMGVLAIEAYPYAAIPASTVAIDNDPVAALAQARQIADPMQRCIAMAWIIGYPTSPQTWHIDAAEDVMRDLDHLLLTAPTHDDAATLRRQVAILRDVLIGANKGPADRIAHGPANRHHIEAADLALQALPGEPTFAQSRFVAGTLLYWMMMEAGKKPQANYPHPDVYIEAARAAYPEARLPRIYLGERLAASKRIDTPTGAPQWAQLFHRLLTRVTDVHLWWVNEKQDAEGLLGGGFGDDVEATRSWPVSIVVADLEPVRAGWRKLAEYGWRANPYVYQNRMNDIEHGSEDFADSHMFPIFFEHGTPGQKVFLDRASGLWPVFRDVWSYTSPSGLRMFKSSNVSLTEAAAEPAGDSAYGTRCLAPGFFQLYFVDDPAAKELMLEYAENWREAILADRSGKPAGICPVWINPDRSFGITKGKWWTGMIGIHYPIPAYNVYDLLLGAYDLSKDERYLEPIWAGMELIGKTPRPSGAMVDGSLPWALYAPYIYDVYTGERFIIAAAATARDLSGNRKHDELLLKHGSPALRARIMLERGGKEPLTPVIEEMTAALEEMDYNVEMVTSEVRRTDRIYLAGTAALLNMATLGSTGGGNASSYWPSFHVTWQDTGTDVAMFITRSEPAGVSGLLYNFKAEPKTIGAKLWRLKPGKYEAVLRPTDGLSPRRGVEPVARVAFEYKGKGDAVRLTLPARQEVFLEIGAVK